MKSVVGALKVSLDSPRAWLQAVAVAFGVFALLVMIPVWTTPGNDIAFQLSITPWEVLLLMALLSALNGALFAMHRRAKRSGSRLKAKESTTLLGIAGASVLSTLACAACYSSVLAVFGVGGTAFVVMNRWWFAAIAIGLTLFAMHATAKKVNGTCKEGCDV